MRRALFLFVIAATSCSPRPEHAAPAASAQPQTPAPSPSGLPPITIRSHGSDREPVRIIQRQGNRKLYELVARSTESSLQSQNRFRGSFLQTHVTFYGRDGSRLLGNAPVARIDRAAQTVTMQGGFKGQTSDGIVLTCDQLEYSRATGQLRGTGNVHIVNSSDGQSMTGGSFTSDLKLTQVHMQ